LAHRFFLRVNIRLGHCPPLILNQPDGGSFMRIKMALKHNGLTAEIEGTRGKSIQSIE
jgi:hypothetical protein